MIDKSSISKNFWLIVVLNSLFFSAYVVFKFPLTSLLQKHGVHVLKSYSLTTTANIVFAMCALAYGIVLQKFKNQKYLITLGVILNTLAILVLVSAQHELAADIAVSLHVVGGSLYFFSIILYINKQFVSPELRLRGNYFNQATLNIGGLVGSIICIAAFLQAEWKMRLSVIIMMSSLLLFLTCYRILKDEYYHFKEYLKITLKIMVLCVLSFLVIHFDLAMRDAIVIFFSLAALSSLYFGSQKNYADYRAYLCLVLLVSVPYWIANVIFYTQFFSFINDTVNSYHGVSSDYIFLLDPISNIIVGFFAYRFFKVTKDRLFFHIETCLLVLTLSFFMLTIAIHTNFSIGHINLLIPAIFIFLIASAEFFIQTTMSSWSKSLIHSYKNQVLAVSMLRSSRAFAAAVAYFLISHTVGNASNTVQEFKSGYMLYLISGILMLIFCFLLKLVKKHV